MKILQLSLSSAALILSAALAFPVTASDANNGYITYIYGTSNGAVLFNTSGVRGAVPACQGASVPQRFAINASTVAGQAQASLLLTAYSLHKQIYIHGSGVCDIWGDTETVNFFMMVED